MVFCLFLCAHAMCTGAMYDYPEYVRSAISLFLVVDRIKSQISNSILRFTSSLTNNFNFYKIQDEYLKTRNGKYTKIGHGWTIYSLIVHSSNTHPIPTQYAYLPPLLKTKLYLTCSSSRRVLSFHFPSI